MQLDSGICLASLEVNGVLATIETRGEVRVLWNPDPNGNAEDGEVYRQPSDFPEELAKVFEERRNTAEMRNIYIDNNNWFEVFVFTKKKKVRSSRGNAWDWTGYAEVTDPENFSPETLFDILYYAILDAFSK